MPRFLSLQASRLCWSSATAFDFKEYIFFCVLRKTNEKIGRCFVLEEEIVRHAAPTLARLKTASAFTYAYPSEHSLQEEIISLNQILQPKGVLVLPLRLYRSRALIYVFRPQMLFRDLLTPLTQRMLSAEGYITKDIEKCFLRLADRLADNDNFPHEIGFFLGYPPSDVRGFIINKAKNYKALGLWKVYSDVESAKRTFSVYQSCSEWYLCRYRSGEDLAALTLSEKKD